MVNIYIAYTQPVNPPNTSIISRSQAWAGLQRKVRNATEFVKPITSCKVLKEDGNIVTREVVFAEGFGDMGGKTVIEVCKEYAPTKVDFHQQLDGSLIQNIISDGLGGDDQDLQMTYIFEWLKPEVVAGSTEEENLKLEYRAMAKMAVDSSISAIRGMVEAGELV